MIYPLRRFGTWKLTLDDGWPESEEKYSETCNWQGNIWRCLKEGRCKCIRHTWKDIDGYVKMWRCKGVWCEEMRMWAFKDARVWWGLDVKLWRCDIMKMEKRKSREIRRHRRFCNLLHTDPYTYTLLHTEPFTHRLFYTDLFTHRIFHTQTLLHTNTFTHRPFYPQTLLHPEAFTPRSFYTKTLLHTDTFTHRCFYT